jgi:hypothetical protein
MKTSNSKKEQAKVAHENGRWIGWDSTGKRSGPVGRNVPVDVKLRCGSEHFDQMLSSDSWMDLWGDESIVAYRLHNR